MKGTLFCVSEPKTAILGGPDIHLKEGSTMNLTCRITDSPEPPSYIFWRHDDSVRHAIRTHTHSEELVSEGIKVQVVIVSGYLDK